MGTLTKFKYRRHRSFSCTVYAGISATMYRWLVCFVFALSVNVSVGEECEEIMVPMCRGLVGYTHTKLPNKLKHKHQRQVYRFLEPIWPFMDRKCSNNLRQFACGITLPKCTMLGNKTHIELPCKESCFYSKKECTKDMKKLGLKWPKKLKCKGLRRKKQKGCMKPSPKLKKPHAPKFAYCQKNTFPMCENVTFDIGTLPNMFHQSTKSEIFIELDQYRMLAESGCHKDIWFLLCGIFRPYCIAHNPFTVPCRETCEEVRSSCESTYRKLYGGLRWPAKLQCHRYPEVSINTHRCVIPGDNSLAVMNVN